MRLAQHRPSPRVEAVRLAALVFALAVCAHAPVEARAAHGLRASAPQQPQVVVQQGQKGAEARAADTGRAQSVVRGRILYEDNDRPVRRARVYIQDPSQRDGSRGYHMVWSNGRGEFIMRNVPAGHYYITVEAGGVITIRPESPETQKELPTVTVDGTNSADVKVRVRRGGAISGRVTHADGEPAVDAPITVRRRQNGKLSQFHTSTGWRRMEVLTDDRGFYRVSGLPPGEYVVGASEQKMGMGERDEQGGTRMYQSALSTTFYAGATNARQATAVTVGDGAEVEDIDITLIERGAHNVSGTVVERGTQRPVPNAEVALHPKDEPADSDRVTQPPTTGTDAQGRWWLDEVEVGIYLLTVIPRQEHEQSTSFTASDRATGEQAAAPRRGFVVKRQDLVVSGGDVAGVVVEVSSGGRVSGVVSVEGSRPLPPGVMVFSEAESGDRRQRLASAASAVRPDGTFTLDGLPEGALRVRAFVTSGERAKYYTKSVTGADGIDLQGQPLRVEEGGEVKGVRVVLATDIATVAGRVLTAQGDAPVRGAFVVLIPTDPARRRLLGTRLSAFTAADGSFTAAGAPGEYAVVILRPGEAPRGPDDALLDARFDAARRVTLRPSERVTVSINAPDDK